MEINVNDLMLSFSTALDYVEKSLVGVSSGHSKRVAALSSKMSAYFSQDSKQRFFLTVAAALHDNALTEFISEELIPSGLKESKMNDYIGENLGRHCVMGEQNVSTLSFYPEIKDVVLYHHEQADGNGPFHKEYWEVPLFARIIHFADICDVKFHFDKLDREKYQRINEFLEGDGQKLFDKECIAAFRQIPYEELSQNSFNEELASIAPIKKDYNSEQVQALAGFFAKIIDYKSPFTSRHSLGVAQKAMEMSVFYGWDEEEQNKMYLAGAVHDVGKLAVDSDVLHKEGKLTSEEYEEIQNHAIGTYNILSKIGGLEEITAIASHHHEMLDGTGYPFKKTAKDLTMKERVMAVVDIYQALTEPRPYKTAMTHHKAMTILNDMAEKGKLDKQIVMDINKKYGA